MSLKARIVGYAVSAVLLCIVCVAVLAGSTLSARMEEQARRAAEAQARSVTNSLSETERRVEQHMLAIGRWASALDSANALTSDVLRGLRNEGGVDEITLVSNDGVYVASSTRGVEGFDLFAVAPEFRGVASGERPRMVTPLKIRAEDGATFKYAAVPSASGTGFAPGARRERADLLARSAADEAAHGAHDIRLGDRTGRPAEPGDPFIPR